MRSIEEHSKVSGSNLWHSQKNSLVNSKYNNFRHVVRTTPLQVKENLPDHTSIINPYPKIDKRHLTLRTSDVINPNHILVSERIPHGARSTLLKQSLDGGSQKMLNLTESNRKLLT